MERLINRVERVIKRVERFLNRVERVIKWSNIEYIQYIIEISVFNDKRIILKYQNMILNNQIYCFKN